MNKQFKSYEDIISELNYTYNFHESENELIACTGFVLKNNGYGNYISFNDILLWNDDDDYFDEDEHPNTYELEYIYNTVNNRFINYHYDMLRLVKSTIIDRLNNNSSKIFLDIENDKIYAYFYYTTEGVSINKILNDKYHHRQRAKNLLENNFIEKEFETFWKELNGLIMYINFDNFLKELPKEKNVDR